MPTRKKHHTFVKWIPSSLAFSLIYVNQTFQVLSEASKTDARKRGILCKLYEEAAEFFKQLESDAIMKTLQESLGDFKTTLEENLKSIKPRDQYVVLVAGEQNSTVVLFTDKYLPHFNGKCVSYVMI